MLKYFLLTCSILTSLMIDAAPINPVTGETENCMYIMEKQTKKLFMGIEIRTDNQKCLVDMPQVWGKFFQEKILEKIPHKVSNTVFALYADYDDDYTKPYSYILGCEVSTLDNIPEGLVGKVVPASSYAVFSTQGAYPQSLGTTWQAIWKSPLKRAYTYDFEVYTPDFNPQTKPEVKVYIAL